MADYNSPAERERLRKANLKAVRDMLATAAPADRAALLRMQRRFEAEAPGPEARLKKRLGVK